MNWKKKILACIFLKIDEILFRSLFDDKFTKSLIGFGRNKNAFSFSVKNILPDIASTLCFVDPGILISRQSWKIRNMQVWIYVHAFMQMKFFTYDGKEG